MPVHDPPGSGFGYQFVIHDLFLLEIVSTTGKEKCSGHYRCQCRYKHLCDANTHVFTKTASVTFGLCTGSGRPSLAN